ncbi:hypothetical protein [Aliamphritea hakodatensis]|uniref:hypothetical protein n=1 Tax=Aliamphritea hakodatensis TaxID=2895352 RepID=UPI0022FD7764|nr:hypothetical protein [Aliamphritea hakodatensis]
MKWREWLDEWGMTSLKIKTPFLDAEWQPKEQDKVAAWQLYVELLTRVTTQKLEMREGDEYAALASVHQLFPLTRDILRENGRHCLEFTKIAVIVLNQIIRPFTSKWHPVAKQNGFDTSQEQCEEFRADLSQLQEQLTIYTQMLSQMAGVEDLTAFEVNDEP